MEFRKASIKDADKIADLLKQGFNIESLREGREIFLKENKRDNYIIAEDDNKLQGIISWGVRGVPKHQLARIARICIRNSKKRKDIAKGLLSAAIQDADKFFKKQGFKLRKMYAMVRSNNKNLKEFYKKMGFIEEAKLKDHYYKGEDEYFLSLFFE